MSRTGPGPPTRGALLAAAALLADAAFLRGLWLRFDHWGIWDWDFASALFEVARKTIVEYGELPLWNPWLGGGTTLVGNPLSNAFAPSFLPILALGTIPGLKIVLLLYTWIAQIGTYRLARTLGLAMPSAVLAALVFSWGGVFAQHYTHGHIGWIGYAWLPFVVRSFHRAAAPGPFGWGRAGDLAAGATFLALSWLDGGPYHYVLVPAFLGTCAAVFALNDRSPRAFLVLPVLGALGVGLAAVEILPNAEMALAFPRPTHVEDHYYGVPFEPTPLHVLYQAFLSPDQAHDPLRWQPFVLNVGSYVGLLPLLLALAGLALRPRRAWPWAVLTFGWLVICLGGTLPPAMDPWPLLHRLPGWDSMQIPVRFRILPLLTLGLLAAIGLQALLEGERLGAARRIVVSLILALVASDLLIVNGRVFRSAFVVPPIPVEPREILAHELRLPYRFTYRRTAVEPIFPNWPTGALPAVLANQGLLLEFMPGHWPRATLPESHPDHPGVEAFPVEGSSRIVSWSRTPNHVTLNVIGQGGTLVVNQNHQPGWTTTVGRVLAWRGLLAVRVPPGEHEIRLSFRPPWFIAGAGLSLASAAILALVALRSRRARELDSGFRTRLGAIEAMRRTLRLRGTVRATDPAPEIPRGRA